MDKIKGMFSSPKRVVISVIVLVLMLGILGTGIAVAAVYLDHREDILESRLEQKFAENLQSSEQAATAQTQSESANAANTQKITAEQAEDIALKDAGIVRADADRVFSHFEIDDGLYQYDVQIYKGEYEYEYNINAENGSILEKDMDYIYD